MIVEVIRKKGVIFLSLFLVSYSIEAFSSQPNQEDCDLLCQLGLSDQPPPKPPPEPPPEVPYEIPSHRLVYNGGMTFEIGSNDPFTGVSIEYHENGQPEEKIFYKNGIEVGRTITEFSYHENGKLREVVDTKDGVIDGSAESFYESGQLQSRGNYKNGNLDGQNE